jgi:hypothetical protein
MEVKDFCQAMESEITSWKAKLYDVMRKIDKLGTSEREKMLGNIQDLHIFLDDMSSRVDQLRNECPADWSPIKKKVDRDTVDIRSKYEETMELIGKAAPVSIPG